MTLDSLKTARYLTLPFKFVDSFASCHDQFLQNRFEAISASVGGGASIHRLILEYRLEVGIALPVSWKNGSPRTA